jgi:decaprenylphospho-beta-D-erythro-pentofuranosid-2-ulose 2-reductase
MRNALGAPQTVLVLGGGSEIALALVRRLQDDRPPANVVLAVREPGRVDAKEIEERGTAVDIVHLDATDRASHPGFVDETFARYPDVDLVVVAFGVLGDQLQDERDAEAAVGVIETNFVGAVSLLVPIAERLREQGHGAIVVLSSVAGERPRRANFVYGSSKAGLDAFAQGLGDSLVGSGVHVLIVRPGFVATKMTRGLKPAPLATTPAAVADEIVRGLARNADTVWAPAKLRYVMFVLRHLPRPIFRLLRS